MLLVKSPHKQDDEADDTHSQADLAYGRGQYSERLLRSHTAMRNCLSERLRAHARLDTLLDTEQCCERSPAAASLILVSTAELPAASAAWRQSTCRKVAHAHMARCAMCHSQAHKPKVHGRCSASVPAEGFPEPPWPRAPWCAPTRSALPRPPQASARCPLSPACHRSQCWKAPADDLWQHHEDPVIFS